MAVSSSCRRNRELVVLHDPIRKFKDRDCDEDTTITTTCAERIKHERRLAAVVYYLARNGQLEHPHFIQVPHSSPDGLYLRDVINRLNALRGKGMAGLYSWSSKRSYRNGFVWQDLAEDDIIYPVHGHEYVLKGSELLHSSINPSKQPILETTTSSSIKLLKPPETYKSSSSEELDFPVIRRQRNQSWSSVDLNEYKVYKTESLSESTRKLATDASTQTDDKRSRKNQMKQEEEIEELLQVNREEIVISPPPSDSSPETLESLMKADGRLILGSGNDNNSESINRTMEHCGRIKASTVLMQLISCGSISFRDCGATAVKEQGLSLIGHYKGRLPLGGGGRKGTAKEIGSSGGVRLEDKEYFSGSLIETKKEQVPALKRSNSYNADRSSHLQLPEKEAEGARTKCIPRKPKATLIKNESSITQSNSNSLAGSKRFDGEKIETLAK